MDKRFLIAAFLEGFFLVAIELLYVQLLHPYYGDSYFAWLSMLSITMTGSALGYFVGAWVAKKQDVFVQRYTMAVLTALILLFSFIHPLSEALFVGLAEFKFLQALVLHTISILLIPVLLITSFSPLIVSFHARSEGQSGKAASKVFFTSTIGGVVAVYGMAFGLMPRVDLLVILKALSVGLLLVSALALLSMKYLRMAALQLVVLMFVQFIGFSKQEEKMEGKNTKVIVRQQGIMGEVEVREEFGKMRYVSLNRTTQSAIEIATGLSTWSYPYRVSTYASMAPPGGDVLVAGLGGGVLVNQLVELNLNVRCVEFDARMVKMAKRYMNLSPKVDVEIDDFRHHINATKRKYDLIILDLSKGETMPGNVYSVEAFRKMTELLKPDGFIMLHYFSNVYGKGDFGLNCILQTMQRAGYFFALVKKYDANVAPEEIIIASTYPELIRNQRIRIPQNVLDKYDFPATDFFDKSRDFSDGFVLYDDKNTMEKVQLEIVADIREKLRQNERLTFFEIPQ